MIPEFRAACFVLAVISVALMIGITIYRWRAMDPPDRLVRVGFATLLGAAAYGFSNVPTPATNVFRYILFVLALLQITVALGWTVVRTFRRRRQDAHRPH